MISAFIFDVANVIVDWNKYRAGTDDEQLREFVDSPAWQLVNHALDSGQELDTALALVGAAEQELYRRYLDNFPATVVGPVPGTSELILELRARGYGIYGLSNWGRDWFTYARAAAPIIDTLDDVVVSGEVGIAKPAPGIYTLALARFGLDPAQALFIDDCPQNLPPAAQLGLQTLLFTTADQLRADLASARVL